MDEISFDPAVVAWLLLLEFCFKFWFGNNDQSAQWQGFEEIRQLWCQVLTQFTTFRIDEKKESGVVYLNRGIAILPWSVSQ